MNGAAADWTDAARRLALASDGERAGLLGDIRGALAEADLWPASIGPIYRAIGQGDLPPMTVPAMNLRGLTYDAARAAVRAARALEAGPVVFELAPSEAEVTRQSFAEYATMVMLAAAAEGHAGPVFLQGDHVDVADDEPASLDRARRLAGEALDAGFRQIDIDAAALATASLEAGERQAANAAITASMTSHIHALQADAVVGGEVGEIGGANTTEADLRAFLAGVRDGMEAGRGGLGKVSIQTGTRHGGVVGADGRAGTMPVDVDLARALSAIARAEFGLPGVVQHGASTLTLAQLGRLPAAGVIEVHLATGIQNLILDHPALPVALVERMKRELAAPSREAEPGGVEPGEVAPASTTPEQAFYQNRWQAWGRYKRELWELPEPTRDAIASTLEAWFAELFTALAIHGRSSGVRLAEPST